MEFQRIRVLLDLSELKDRLHKYVWMLVSTSDIKSIADFKDAVIKKLALDRNVKDIKMFINGGLLLEEENILILRDNDAVQIQYENISTTDPQSTSCIGVQASLISDVGLSSELCNDNLGKAVERPKKKKSLSEVNGSDALNNYREEYSHKRKRKRDLVSNELSENQYSINLSPEESSVTFCDINEESICSEKKKKQKKSHKCSTSTPKEDFVENEQYNNAQEKTAATVWDINGENTHKSKKSNLTQYSCSSMAKDTTIQIEENYDKNVIYAESAFVVSDNKNTAKEKKRKSCSYSTSRDAFIPNQHSGDDEEISIIPVEISLDDSSQEINKMEISNNDPSNPTIESFVQTNNCKKRKRKRHRKRRIEHNLVSPFMAENIITLPQPVGNLPTFNSYDNSSGVRKHIRFTSPEPDSKKKETEVVDLENCNLNNVSEVSLNTSLNKSSTSTNGKTSSINGRLENHTTPVANVSSLNMNAAYSLKSIELNSSTFSSSKSNYLHELSLKNPVPKSKEYEPSRNVALYPPLNSLPCVGTCIAFKLLELNESYSPEVSSYKEGVIKSINPKTEEIEIELTKEEIKPGRIGKFENLKEGELPVIEVTDKVTTCWSSLIEPRLVSQQ